MLTSHSLALIQSSQKIWCAPPYLAKMTLPEAGEENELLPAPEQLCRRVSLARIRSTTQNFDDGFVIGLGGFGKVYKGYINDGPRSIPVAIKRLDSMSNQGAPEFKAEIEMLSKLRHCNLVSLIGYYNDSKEMVLVYEYMPRGALDFHLYKADTPLTWVHRLKISMGAARGLDYLHTGSGTEHGVIHRDVKSSNILLDENWAAKISDFGLSKIGPINQPSSYVNTGVKGTFGYVDPDYFLTGRLTRKSDVYAFGVVLFELVSGRRAVDTSLDEEQWSLARWAQTCVKERKLDQIVDSNIKGQISSKCLKEFAQIASRCLHSHAKERPTMAEVVVSLQQSLALQEKFDNSAHRARVTGFTWKMQKYLVFPTKENSGHGDTNSSRNSKADTNCSPMPTDDGGDHNEVPPGNEQIMSQDLKVFSYIDLKRATSNFHIKMRRGCPATSAWVFKGWIDKKTYSPSVPGIGLAIAVKRLHHCSCGSLEKAKLDLKMLGEISHPNLDKLIGYCLRGNELFLVYEFMQNESLEDYLLYGGAAQLPLTTRIKIAVGVARGLVFLYNTQNEAREWLFEMHNILLDEEFNAKLSDFDVAKLVHGHSLEDHNLDCYYHPWRKLRKSKSRNFGFEVVLLELLSVLQISTKGWLINGNALLGDKASERQSDGLFREERRNVIREWVIAQLDLNTSPAFVNPARRRNPPQIISHIRPDLTTLLKKLEEVYASMTETDRSLQLPRGTC